MYNIIRKPDDLVDKLLHNTLINGIYRTTGIGDRGIKFSRYSFLLDLFLQLLFYSKFYLRNIFLVIIYYFAIVYYILI